MQSLRRATIFALGVALTTAGLAAIAAPATAASGTVSASGNTITFTGSDVAELLGTGGNHPDLVCGTPYCVHFHIPGGTVSAGAGCVQHVESVAFCSTPGPATVFINLGGGDDNYYYDPAFPGLGSYTQVTVDGGEGNDLLNGGGAPETLIGGNGNDVITPDQGPNAANVGPDVLIGGPGGDTLYYNKSAAQASGVRLSLNGQADDGTSNPRDVDNVGSDFEGIVLTTGPDNAIGDGANTTFYGLEGNDAINGGAGADRVIGQAGNDTLDGGPGIDRVWGDSHTDATVTGNDTIVTADGEADDIACGPGTDAVTADSLDKILDACESVTTGGGTVLSADLAVTKTRLNANKRRKKATLALQCTGGLVCAGNVVVRTTKGKSRRIAGNKKLALGTFTLTANSKKTVKLKLRRPARKILKQTRRAGVRARLTLTNERVTTFTTLKLAR